MVPASIVPAPAAPAGVPAAPNHDGKAHDGKWVVFGDPTAAIGSLISASSSMTAADAQHVNAGPPPPVPATWTAPVGLLAGLGTGAVGGAVVMQLFWSVLARPMLRAIGAWGDATRSLSSLTTIAVALLCALVLAVVGLKLGRRLAPKFATRATIPGEGKISTFVGTEGVARSRRTASGVEVDVVRFADAPFATYGMTRTTTTYKRNSGTTTGIRDSRSFGIFDGSGRSLLGVSGASYSSDYLRGDDVYFMFAEAAARAFDAYWIPQLLPASLTAAGVRFPFGPARAHHFLLAAGRIDVVRGAAQSSFAPAEVTRLAVAGGQLILAAPRLGELTVPMAELCNARLLVACLAAQGVQVS